MPGWPRCRTPSGKTEPELWKEFNEAAPEILGALLTGLSMGLRRLPTIKVTLPRMATFAQFAMGCETAYGRGNVRRRL